jgi:biopolymer transport protein ExbD
VKRSRFKMPKSNGTFALNINSMTDMFTIMLVFLLQTYSTNAFEIKPQKNIQLPTSTVEKNIAEALDISLSPIELKIKDTTIVSLNNTQFRPENLDPSDSDLIVPLLEKLQAYSAELKEKNTGELILQADRTLPYNTLKKVFYTASVAGFPKLKLATQVGN